MARTRIKILVAIWLASAATGLSMMLNYELRPAQVATPTAVWPASSQLVRDVDRPTLLVFVHPRCPCSRASLAELNVLASDCRNRVDIHILFVTPAGFADGWEQTDLFETAQRIPGAQVARDAEGVEAARFGATTSGETLLYGPDGRLQFRGGLTASRGHEGDNQGRSAVTALINTGRSEIAGSAVYGCPLKNQCLWNKECATP